MLIKANRYEFKRGQQVLTPTALNTNHIVAVRVHDTNKDHTIVMMANGEKYVMDVHFDRMVEMWGDGGEMIVDIGGVEDEPLAEPTKGKPDNFATLIEWKQWKPGEGQNHWKHLLQAINKKKEDA